jgi:hypothetical protein
MAVLSADTYLVFDPQRFPVMRHWKVGAITDIFYRGGVLTHVAGLALPTSVDASEFAGMCMSHKTFAGTAGYIEVYIDGIFWASASVFTDANITHATNKYLAATAGSDNPNDLITLAAGTTGQVGTIAHVDVTGTSGWFDCGIGARGAFGTNS